MTNVDFVAKYGIVAGHVLAMLVRSPAHVAKWSAHSAAM